LLMACEFRQGTFLIRPSEQYQNRFSLRYDVNFERCISNESQQIIICSVKDFDRARRFHVKHYKIKPRDNGGYYIATTQIFPNLFDLVSAYSRK
jgi:tyrosine-protein kinase Src